MFNLEIFKEADETTTVGEKIAILREEFSKLNAITLCFDIALFLYSTYNLLFNFKEVCNIYTIAECEDVGLHAAAVSRYNKKFNVVMEGTLFAITLFSFLLDVREFLMINRSNYKEIKREHNFQEVCFSLSGFIVLALQGDIITEDNEKFYNFSLIISLAMVLISTGKHFWTARCHCKCIEMLLLSAVAIGTVMLLFIATLKDKEYLCLEEYIYYDAFYCEDVSFVLCNCTYELDDDNSVFA